MRRRDEALCCSWSGLQPRSGARRCPARAHRVADDANPHSVVMQRCKIVTDEPAQQTEQVADFGCRTRPVFRTKREYRQIENAEFAGRANDPAQSLDTAPMPFGARQAAGRCPTSVAVHDDRHMQGSGRSRSGPSAARRQRRSTSVHSQAMKLDGENFFFLCREQLIDLRNRCVGRLLHISRPNASDRPRKSRDSSPVS